MLSPIYSLLYWFPLVGGLLGALGSFICCLVGLILATVFSLIIISISWIYHRPKIALIFLGIALAVGGYIAYDYFTRKGD